MRRLLFLLLPLAMIAVSCGDDDAATDVAGGPSGELPVDDGTGNGPDDEPIAEPGDPPPPDEATTGDELPLGAGPYPIADLTFTIHPDGPDGAVVTYRLACLGDTATFTGDSTTLSESAACLALTDGAVRTRVLEGAPADQVCTEIYGGPQLAEIIGTLDGESVSATVDRANGCGINDYDVVLAALLPAAGGA
jgi:hypothetical protein